MAIKSGGAIPRTAEYGPPADVYSLGIIIWEIFGGEASKAADANAGVKAAFNALRLIVLVGWAIYPLGYIFGYMMGSVDSGSLNIIYNLADFVNKILFGLIIWNVAVKESDA